MKVLILSNLASYTYNFRKELIKMLIDSGCDVSAAFHVDNTAKAKALNCKIIEVPFNGKGTVLKEELNLLKTYGRIMDEEKPDMVLSFTIKMNLYGGIACRMRKIPYYPMITGLGELAKKGKLRPILMSMHRYVMPYATCIFFQNTSDMEFFNHHNIKYKKSRVVPGSGVNLADFKFTEYPKENPLSFAFVGRVTKAKGIEEYLDAAEYFKGKGYVFYVAGVLDEEYKERIERLDKEGAIKYEGELSDVRFLLRKTNCVVLPTFHPEGMSNVLLEAGAYGRPCICTDRTGCREIITDGINGLYCKERDSADLCAVIERFVDMTTDDKKTMCLAARANVEINFDRKLVIEAYKKELFKDENENREDK